MNIGDKVMTSNDGGDKWFTGEVANIEGKFITVRYYNPNSGDSWVGFYDADDKNLEITVIEKCDEVSE